MAVPCCASSSTYVAMLVPKAEIEAADQSRVSGVVCDLSLLLAVEPRLVALTEGPNPAHQQRSTEHTLRTLGVWLGSLGQHAEPVQRDIECD